MKFKSFSLLFGILSFTSSLFISCSDDDDDVPTNRNRSFYYDVVLMNDDYSMQMCIDSVVSDISEITNAPEWVSIEQVGTDENGHPLIQFDVAAEPHGDARDAYVMLTTHSGDKVKMTLMQSLVYSTLGMHDSDDSNFNASNWYEQESINIYYKPDNSLREVYLPWADMAPTAIPEEMCKVNKNPDDWKLCFNTCSNSRLPNNQMFGLFNMNNHTMRIFVYFDETPSDATTCYFVVSTSGGSSAILSGDNLNWSIPLDVAKSNWNVSESMINGMPTDMSSVVVPPICGNTRGSLSPGWVAFDIKLSSSLSTINDIITNPKTRVTLSLLSCDITNTEGTQDFSDIAMKADNIKIMSPGSSTKRTSMGFAAAGNFCQGLSGIIANTAMTGATGAGTGGAIAVAVAGGIGLVSNLVSDCIEADEAGKDQVAYEMSMDFHFSGKTKINTQSITYKGNNFTPVSMTISEMFKYLLYYKSLSTKHRSPLKADDPDEKLNFGIWNIVESPIIYVSKDVLFYNESPSPGTEYNSDGETITSYGKDENLRYASFLDPSSIKLYINDDLSMFAHDHVKNVKVIGYDFIYADTTYTTPDVFYDYYKLTHEKVRLTSEDDSWNNIFIDDDKSMRLVEYDDKNLLLDPENGKLSYNTMKYLSKDMDKMGYTMKYGGVSSDLPTELSSYNAIFSPIIYVPRNSNGFYPVESDFANLGVVVYLSFEVNGQIYNFARRYLPKIKLFGKDDIDAIRNKINNFEKKTYDGLDADYILYDKEKAKALRVLDAVK